MIPRCEDLAVNYCTPTPRTFSNMLPHFTHCSLRFRTHEPGISYPARWHIVSPPQCPHSRPDPTAVVSHTRNPSRRVMVPHIYNAHVASLCILVYLRTKSLNATKGMCDEAVGMRQLGSPWPGGPRKLTGYLSTQQSRKKHTNTHKSQSTTAHHTI